MLTEDIPVLLATIALIGLGLIGDMIAVAHLLEGLQ